MRKRVYILGILLGLVVPYIGIFVGLQVSTVLGNLLAFPVIAIAYFTGTPFGMWHPLLWVVAVVLSIAIWTAIVWFADKEISKKSESS